jgi:hypothetical protein
MSLTLPWVDKLRWIMEDKELTDIEKLNLMLNYGEAEEERINKQFNIQGESQEGEQK